jgi:hypothetical protein
MWPLRVLAPIPNFYDTSNILLDIRQSSFPAKKEFRDRNWLGVQELNMSS